jgi:hypothetical protein
VGSGEAARAGYANIAGGTHLARPGGDVFDFRISSSAARATPCTQPYGRHDRRGTARIRSDLREQARWENPMDTNVITTAPKGTGRRTRAISVLAAGMLLALTLGSGSALADGGRHHGDAENTFTKWITSYPAMAGIIDGDVGSGTYAGEILKYTPGTTTVIEALYHFSGSRHSFTALVHVEQTGLKARISGVVTDGWLRGSAVRGRYTQVTCTHDAITSDCFQGSLDILRGSGD